MAPTMLQNHMPRFAGVALLWLVVIDSLGRFSVGPLSLSGALTIATAAIVLLHTPLLLFLGDKTPASRQEIRLAADAIPWPLVAFLVLAWIRLWASPSVEGFQNVAVYTAFIAGAAILTLGAPASRIVTLLRRLRLVSVAIPLVFVATTLAGVDLFHERAFALAALIFTAILVPYRGRRLIYKIGPVLVVAAIFFSLSRTAAVIAAALLIFTAVRSRRRYRFARAASFAGAVGTGLYWAVTSYAPFRDRFLGGDQALEFGGFSFNTSGRSTLWEITTDSAATSPWAGHGPGSANELISDLFDNISHPHNDYLRLYHDFGIVGATLFSVGLLMVLGRVWRRASRTDDQIHWIAVVALLGVVAAAFTDNVIVYPFVMVPLGLIVGCSLAQPLPPRTQERRRRGLIGIAPSPAVEQTGLGHEQVTPRPELSDSSPVTGTGCKRA